jgi:hypothetical protein
MTKTKTVTLTRYQCESCNAVQQSTRPFTVGFCQGCGPGAHFKEVA